MAAALFATREPGGGAESMSRLRCRHACTRFAPRSTRTASACAALSASLPRVAPKRRSVGGFIVAAVVVGGVLMLGAVWAQKNLGRHSAARHRRRSRPVDPRVATFLANGEKALADGNLELAKESFDKASALSEKDPHVLLGLARLAAVRADVLWLKSRLLPADAADDHRITRDGLSELSANARKAADDALLVAPEDPRCAPREDRRVPDLG